MSLTSLFSILKGGPNSGNHGHSGVPGKRGGSAPSRGNGGIGLKLSTPLAFNSHRKQLLKEAQEDVMTIIEKSGLTLDDLDEVIAYGSFASRKSKPNDIDLVIQFKKGKVPYGDMFFKNNNTHYIDTVSGKVLRNNERVSPILTDSGVATEKYLNGLYSSEYRGKPVSYGQETLFKR